jgi:hypothetical protein
VALYSSLFLKVACYSAFCNTSSSCAVSFCNKPRSFSFAGAVSALNAVMGHPNALQMEYVMAHDTAVSALGKILQFHREKLKAEKVYLLFVVSRLTSKEPFVFHQMRARFSLYFLLDLPFRLMFDWRVCQAVKQWQKHS